MAIYVHVHANKYMCICVYMVYCILYTFMLLHMQIYMCGPAGKDQTLFPTFSCIFVSIFDEQSYRKLGIENNSSTSGLRDT